MIYCEVSNEDEIIQAMRVPDVTDIAHRHDLDFWVCSLKGRREIKYVGSDIVYSNLKWRPGDWIVVRIDTDIGNIVFLRYTDIDFNRKFSRLV